MAGPAVTTYTPGTDAFTNPQLPSCYFEYLLIGGVSTSAASSSATEGQLWPRGNV